MKISVRQEVDKIRSVISFFWNVLMYVFLDRVWLKKVLHHIVVHVIPLKIV
jgi:hypothetical protein